MSLFRRSEPEPDKVPPDPNDPLVEKLWLTYPFGAESFGSRSIIRTIVFVVQEMKSRGMI